MTRYKHLLILIAVALGFLLLSATPAAGQMTVYSGQTSELSVVEVPGATYSWQLFNDDNGVNFATTFGNCPTSSAFMVDDITTGPVVNVTWLEPGTYFYKVTAFNECTSNFKIGMVTVMPLIAGEIQLRAEDEANSCVGVKVGVPIRVVENFSEISSFRIQLTFDPSVIKFSGYKNIHKNLLPSNLTYIEISPGVLNLVYTASGSLSIDDGQILFDVEFLGTGEGLAGIKWNTVECSIRSAYNTKVPALYVVRDLYKVSKSPEISVSVSNPELCQGGPVSLSARQTDDQNLTYRWIDPYNNVYPVSELTIASANPKDSGKYRLIATNDASCETEQTVDIIVNPRPTLQIAHADTICFNSSYLMDAGSNHSEYEWQDGSSSSTYMAYEPGIYWVRVVDKNGCESTQSVALVECTIQALVPNAFTPNGDGLNDTFRPIFDGCEPTNFHMSIYNRWGELIYTTDNKDEGWDGTANGTLMQAGTYVYVISYEVPDYVTKQGFTSPVTGRVNLLR